MEKTGDEPLTTEEWTQDQREDVAKAANKLAATLRKQGKEEEAASAEAFAKQVVGEEAAGEGADTEREGECPEALQGLEAACPFRAELKGRQAGAGAGEGAEAGGAGGAPLA